MDDYHGTKVADPYRWLEDTDSPETLQWVEAENRVSREYFSAIPALARFKDRLTTVYNHERYTSFQKLGSHYIFQRNNGLENQDVMYLADSLHGPERVLLDPNQLRADGTAALGEFVASPDGSLLAYSVADAGSDWQQWHVRNTATGQDLPDVIRWSKFMRAEWSPDKKGFYYLRYPEPKAGESLRDANVNSKLYLHVLGGPQAADQLVYERPDQPHWLFSPTVSADGRYLVISIQTNDFGRNLVAYRDLSGKPGKIVELITEPTGAFNFLGNQGAVFYFHTTDHAPNGRVVAIDLAKPQAANWRVIVPERKESVGGALMAGGKVVVQYVKDAADRVTLFAMDGTGASDLALPGFGQVQFFPSHQTDTEAFFGFTGFTTPRVIYRLDLKTGLAAPVRQPKMSFDLSPFETEQVFYPSKDGTRIPMFVVHRKGLKLDGQNPTLLYAYGGFNVNVSPEFRVWLVPWLEAGGVYASANLRGGAEYGDAWHEAGKREKKQNVFDDFIAAAEYLIAQKYTSTSEARNYGREQRRAARRRVFGATPGSLRRRHADGGRPGYAAVPEVHDRLGMDGRVW